MIRSYAAAIVAALWALVALFALAGGIWATRADAQDYDAQGLALSAKAAAATAPVTVAASSTAVTIYGSGSTAFTAASTIIKGGTIRPGSVLELTARFDRPAPAHAGWAVSVGLGSVANIAQAYPTGPVYGLEFRAVFYVAADLQSIRVATQNICAVASPSTGATCAPFATGANPVTSLTIDLTQDQVLAINVTPQNDDILTLHGFSLVDFGPASPLNMAPANALTVFSDSLGAGTGSLGSFILHPTATYSAGSQAITLSSTAGVLPGMVITGPGIPTGTVLTSTTSMNQAATAAGSSAAVAVFAGAWPQQLMYQSPGRPIYNNSVGGTTSAQISARQALDKVRAPYWREVDGDVCRNDVGNANLTSVCLGNIASMMARKASGVKMAVSTIIPAANEAPGSANWNAIVAANTALLAAYPSLTIDTFSALTNNGTVNIPLMYRNAYNTTASCSSGSAALTVASATGLSTGMYAISPGSTAISTGSTATAPTIASISGTTVTLNGPCSAALPSGSMVSFVGASEVHLNDLGYWIGYTTPIKTWLTANSL